MANKYRVSNGNWDAANSWALTNGGTDYTTVPTSSDNAYFTSLTPTGTHTVNVTANTLDLDFAGFTGTFTGISALNVYGSIALVSGMTYSYSGNFTMRATSGTKTITSAGKTFSGVSIDGVGGTFQLADKLTLNGNLARANGTFSANGQDVELNGSSTQGITASFTGSNSFYNLIRTGGANKTSGLRLSDAITCTNTFTANGNSATNRLLIDSSVKGTARTITAATVSCTNVDLQDITGAGAGSWDLSAITGLSGDCGGNSGITFTSPTTQDCSAGTTWSTATWTSRVPLPQDTATFSGSGRTITQDMPRIGSVNFTGSSGLTWTTSSVCSFFGSINLTNLGTLTASTQVYTYEGRGNSTLTSSGNTWAKAFTINAPGGKLTLGDTFITSGTNSGITVSNGEFNTANNNTTSAFFASSSGTRTLTLGSSIISLYIATGTNTFSSTGLTITANTATIKFTGSLTSNVTMATGGINFNGSTIWNATTNAFDFILTGSGTFGTYKSDASRSLKFTAGTTTTATTWDIGTGCTIGSVTSATHTLAKAGGGTVGVPNVTVSYSTASPSSTFYATGASTNGGNNTNWTFGEIPVAGAFIPRIIFF